VPEGDTVFRIAARFRPLLEGRTLARVDARWPGEVRGLTGRQVESISTHGKQMLVHVDDETALRVHLGIDGRWHRYAPAGRWRRPARDMGLVLATDDVELVCFKPRPIERIARRKLASHAALAALGPDALAEPFDLDEVVARAARPENEDRDVAEVLLDQTLCAGIGNVYKCEALFLERVHPWTATGDLGDAALRALFARASTLMKRNLGDAPRTTTRRRDRRLWVYGAMRRSCLVCGEAVAWEHQGPNERITWWCPRCQSGEEIA
jgi:endonuclease-8